MLERAGGLEAVASAVIDDVALARRVKAAGGKLWLGLSQEIESLRAYEGFLAVQRMVARTAFDQLRYSKAFLILSLAGLLAFLVSPPLCLTAALIGRDARAAVLALAAWVAQALHFLPAVRHLGVPRAYAAALPLASLLYAWMTLVSAWTHHRGRNVPWREREASR
jgi:hypothetical protein